MNTLDESGDWFDNLIDQTYFLYNSEDYQTGLQTARQALELRPGDPAAVTLMGECYFELEEYAHAAVCFQRAIEAWPDYEEASNRLFHSLCNLNRDEEAWAEMKRYLLLADADFYDALLLRLIQASKCAVGIEEPALEELKQDLRSGDTKQFDDLSSAVLRAVRKHRSQSSDTKSA